MKALLSWFRCVLITVAGVASAAMAGEIGAKRQADLANVGRRIFLDTGLSNPPGQGCVSCHQPDTAFADPRSISPGAVAGQIGRRNAPSLMYAALIPNMDQEDLLSPEGIQNWVWQGGLFQDGKARTLHDQVQQPFFEHAEMNVGNVAELAAKMRKSSYADALKTCIGEAAWSDDNKVTHACYRALVEFLKQPMFRPFDAPIDRFLAGDQNALDASQKRGLAVFQGKAKCAECHLLIPSAWPKPLLSDYGYDNLGAPSRGEKDPGLGGHTGAPGETGQFRAPSLRNVELTAPYLHNGTIATLREVMEFYNRRDLEPERWGRTDYPETVNHEHLGNLSLTDGEINDLVVLMSAFTDHSLIEMKKQGSPFPEAPAGTPDSWSMRAFFPDWSHTVTPPRPHWPHKDAAGKE